MKENDSLKGPQWERLKAGEDDEMTIWMSPNNGPENLNGTGMGDGRGGAWYWFMGIARVDMTEATELNLTKFNFL